MLIQKLIRITEEQYHALTNLGSITNTEHIRRAIDDYILKHKKQNTSESLSKGENK